MNLRERAIQAHKDALKREKEEREQKERQQRREAEHLRDRIIKAFISTEPALADPDDVFSDVVTIYLDEPLRQAILVAPIVWEHFHGRDGLMQRPVLELDGLRLVSAANMLALSVFAHTLNGVDVYREVGCFSSLDGLGSCFEQMSDVLNNTSEVTP